MKKQRFYPKQVMRKLAGRSVESLDSGEKAALSFFVRKSRKFDMAIGVLDNSTATVEGCRFKTRGGQTVYLNPFSEKAEFKTAVIAQSGAGRSIATYDKI